MANDGTGTPNNPNPGGNAGGSGDKPEFTQAQVNAIAAQAKREAKEAREALERTQADLEKIKQAQQTESERALAKARDEGKAEADAEWKKREAEWAAKQKRTQLDHVLELNGADRDLLPAIHAKLDESVTALDGDALRDAIRRFRESNQKFFGTPNAPANAGGTPNGDGSVPKKKVQVKRSELQDLRNVQELRKKYGDRLEGVEVIDG